jgi:arabinofuranosyltransferase
MSLPVSQLPISVDRAGGVLRKTVSGRSTEREAAESSLAGRARRFGLARRVVRPLASRRHPSSAVGSWIVILGMTAIGTALAFRRRWIADDGLIYIRAVRQILAGNGPTYNVGERAETSTGTVWQWLLVVVAGVTRIRPDLVAIYLGLFLFPLALLFASSASRAIATLGRPSRDCWTLPFGLLVVVALPPFWDFATSGLETSLTYTWIASSWWLLVRALAHPSTGRDWPVVAWIGFGPLIRPDMAIVALVFFISLPGLQPLRSAARTAGLAATAVALPLMYEVFRMGFYGELFPLPALTKEASGSEWHQGVRYLADFVGPHYIAVPAGLSVIALFAIQYKGGTHNRARTRVIAAPIASGLLSVLYVVRLGGDFMHARMLLPATLLMLLPLFVIKLTRRSIAVFCVVVLWGVASAFFLRVGYAGHIGPHGIADERGAYVGSLLSEHPASPDFVANFDALPHINPPGSDSGTIEVSDFLYPGNIAMPLKKGLPYTEAYVFQLLGMDGAALPLSAAAVDPLGLAYPLVAHFEEDRSGRPGHSKEIPVAWLVADYVDPSAVLPPGLDPLAVAAARHSLTCGPIADLMASARAPLTLSRVWKNFTGAFSRSSLRIPLDPVAAEAQFC